MDRSIPESPSSSTFVLDDGFHGHSSGRNLKNDVTSGRASLDGEPLALAWPAMFPGFPENQRHSDLLGS